MIRFILKFLFILAVILITLPYLFPSHKSNSLNDAYVQNNAPSIVEAFSTVKDVFTDFSKFCDRNFYSCETVRNYFISLYESIIEAGKIAYIYIIETFTGEPYYRDGQNNFYGG